MTARPRALLLAMAVPLVACRPATPATPPARPKLRALFPADARLVAEIDLRAVRGTALAKAIAARFTAEPDPVFEPALVDEFARKTGFDPATDIEGIVAATAGLHSDGGFAFIVRARRFDEARLVAELRETLRRRGDDLVSRTVGGRAFWSRLVEPDTTGFFLDDRTIVIGTRAWTEAIAARVDAGAAASGAAANPELDALAARVAPRYPLWVAMVRMGTGPALVSEWSGGLGGERAALGADLRRGLDVEVLADVRDTQKAAALVERATKGLARERAKVNASSPLRRAFVDGLHLQLDGHTLRSTLSLDEGQALALLARLEEFQRELSSDMLLQ
jgi:hypothetical protein